MADGGGKSSAGNDVVELEAMRKDSFSWHPCEVSLCSRGSGLVVRYGDNYLEETITDKQDILKRLRVRSTPLQGDDCSSLRQGNHVLATRNLHAYSVFYDAQVEKAIYVRHSKRNPCRCSFTIKWLHQALEEEAVTVQASSIMKLATKSINLHPTISAFFSMLESSTGLDILPSSTFVDSLNWEMDINGLLEKQIEEINNSTDAPQEKISKNFIFGLEVDLEGQNHGTGVDVSLKDPPVIIPLIDNLKGSTGCENKQPMETIIEIPPGSISSIQEKCTGSRSPLSPLAARAALALLRSEFPQNAEISDQSNVLKGVITSEHSTTKLLYESKGGSFSAVDHPSNTDDFVIKVSATLGGKSPKVESTKKTLFPTSGAPQKVENVSSRAQVNRMEKRNKISEKKVSQPSEPRVTRAQIQRNNGMHESTGMTNAKETQLRSSTRRVTRSSVNRAGKIEVKECNLEAEENTLTKGVALDSSARSNIVPNNHLSDNQKRVASPVHGEGDKNHLGNDGMLVNDDCQKGNIAEDEKRHKYPKRKETERSNVQPKLKSRKTNVSESNELDLFNENASVGNKELERESLASPIATRVSEQFTDESDKDSKTFTLVKTTPNCAESVGSSQGKTRKCAISKKQERQFSPSLRFLPRTRFQTKG